MEWRFGVALWFGGVLTVFHMNIHEVTDFHGGFLTIFSADYTAHEYLYMRRKYLTIPWHFQQYFT